MNENAIQVEHVSKMYKLYNRLSDRLREALGMRVQVREHYALKDVDFSVKRGETVGIIGTNGSGKSTVLKIITGVVSPTSGQVKVDGRISALLELGAGFNMEYTGIENVYLNGTMIGFSKEEIDSRLDEILSFADIGDFVYQPVKSYSSGMFVRLAFALAINVEPEILIVDEALAVGDVFFQAKCYKKIHEIRESGTTVLLVTHDMGTIIKYCDKVVVLNRGAFVAEGEPGPMVDLYKKILAGQFDGDDLEGIGQKADFAEQLLKERETAQKTAAGSPERESMAAESKASAAVLKSCSVGQKDAEASWLSGLARNADQLKYGDGSAQITDVGIFDHKGELTNLLMKGKPFTIRMKVRFEKEVQEPIFAFTIKDSKGTELTGTNSLIESCETGLFHEGETAVASFVQNMDLQGKDYLLSLGCTGYVHGEFVVFDRLYDVVNLTVISEKNTVGYFDMNSQVKVERL